MSDNKSTIKLHKNRNFDIEEHKWLGVCPDECKPYSKTGGHVYYCRAEETQVLIDHIIKQDWHITYLYDQIKEHKDVCKDITQKIVDAATYAQVESSRGTGILG